MEFYFRVSHQQMAAANGESSPSVGADQVGGGDIDEECSEGGLPSAAAVHPFAAALSGPSQSSRLQSEFSFMSFIGKGGFGEVMKFKNNLDGQVYAIKRIKLNPKNSQVTRKIMREVKLLSRLHHDNVVRYYTSWIEVVEAEAKAASSSSEDGSSSGFCFLSLIGVLY